MDKVTLNELREVLVKAQERLMTELERFPMRQKYSDVKLVNELGEYVEKLNVLIDNDAAGEKEELYAITVVADEGYDDGADSLLYTFDSFEKLVNEMYDDYTHFWSSLEENGKLYLEGSDEGPEEEMLDSNGNGCLSKEEFEKHLLEYGYVYIQLDDCHYQYEYKGKIENTESI